MYESFRRYQTSMLEQFDHLAEEYKFKVIDATPEPRKIFEKLRAGITKVLEGESHRPAHESSVSAAPNPTAVVPLVQQPAPPVPEPATRAAESTEERVASALPKTRDVAMGNTDS
jgi:hypothetical protein